MGSLYRYWHKYSIIYCVLSKVEQFIIAHVSQVQFLKYGAESEYNSAFTAVMAIAYFRMLNNYSFYKDLYLVTEQAPLVILFRK